MNIKTLQYFIAIADGGSFTAASVAIPIAQPALTRQMRDLEADLGVQLLHRLPRGVRLTQAGVNFYESAQKILAENSRIRQKLGRVQEVGKSRVVFGTSPTLARVLTPGLFENCYNTLKNVELHTREAFTPVLIDWLERGIIDMAVVTNPESGRSVSMQPLLGEPFALVSHYSMNLDTVVSVNKLTRLPLLMTNLHRGIIERQMSVLGKSLNIEAEIDSVDSISELVHRGRWATVMPISVFKQVDKPNELVLSEISGIQLSRILVLATRLDPVPTLSLSLVRELVEAEISKLVRLGIFSFGAR